MKKTHKTRLTLRSLTVANLSAVVGGTVCDTGSLTTDRWCAPPAVDSEALCTGTVSSGTGTTVVSE